MFSILLTLVSFALAGEPVKVIVLDTGYKPNAKFSVPLCPGRVHYDATKRPGTLSYAPPMDTHGHGTHIVSTIFQYAEGAQLTDEWGQLLSKNISILKLPAAQGYCFIIVKYYTGTEKNSAKNWIRAQKYIKNLKPPFILNLSGGGPDRLEEEAIFVRQLLSKGNTIVAAVGNDSQNLTENGKTYYPAMEPGVTAVGAFYITKKKLDTQKPISSLKVRGKSEEYVYVYPSDFSNYGLKKIVWGFGSLYGAGLNDDIVNMSGTSQATAMRTGLIVRSKLKGKK